MPEWFAPKAYGWGSRPASWQGWLVTTAYVSLIIAATQLLGGRAWAMGSVIVTATALFLLTVMRTTRGGWRWRWGGKE